MRGGNPPAANLKSPSRARRHAGHPPRWGPPRDAGAGRAGNLRTRPPAGKTRLATSACARTCLCCSAMSGSMKLACLPVQTARLRVRVASSRPLRASAPLPLSEADARTPGRGTSRIARARVRPATPCVSGAQVPVRCCESRPATGPTLDRAEGRRRTVPVLLRGCCFLRRSGGCRTPRRSGTAGFQDGSGGQLILEWARCRGAFHPEGFAEDVAALN